MAGTPEHAAQVQKLSDRTTTVLRNDADLLPLTANPGKVLVTGIGDTVLTARSPQWLADSMNRRGATATALPTGANPTATTIASAVAAANTSDLVVVLTNNLKDRTAQRSLVSALLATGKPVVAVASQIPYDAGYVDAPTWLATYSWRSMSMESLAKVLFGELSPAGKLPVDVPVGGGTEILYPFDHGLTW